MLSALVCFALTLEKVNKIYLLTKKVTGLEDKLRKQDRLIESLRSSSKDSSSEGSSSSRYRARQRKSKKNRIEDEKEVS